jgi:hypothetical protein
MTCTGGRGRALRARCAHGPGDTHLRKQPRSACRVANELAPAEFREEHDAVLKSLFC